MVPQDGGSEFARVAFQSKRLMAQIRTMLPVRVVKVYKQDGTSQATRGEVAGASAAIDAHTNWRPPTSLVPRVRLVEGPPQQLPWTMMPFNDLS